MEGGVVMEKFELPDQLIDCEASGEYSVSVIPVVVIVGVFIHLQLTTPEPVEPDRVPTNAISVMVSLELIWGISYSQTARCESPMQYPPW
tara:strand:- start:23614 stop:23883 length:270 start_codon:yes stop_codon:yes gene_type:complete